MKLPNHFFDIATDKVFVDAHNNKMYNFFQYKKWKCAVINSCF